MQTVISVKQSVSELITPSEIPRELFHETHTPLGKPSAKGVTATGQDASFLPEGWGLTVMEPLASSSSSALRETAQRIWCDMQGEEPANDKPSCVCRIRGRPQSARATECIWRSRQILILLRGSEWPGPGPAKEAPKPLPSDGGTRPSLLPMSIPWVLKRAFLPALPSTPNTPQTAREGPMQTGWVNRILRIMCAVDLLVCFSLAVCEEDYSG